MKDFDYIMFKQHKHQINTYLTQYLHNIYTIQHLHKITEHLHNIYTKLTQHLNNFYTVFN